MSDNEAVDAFWVHLANQPRKARIHLRDCHYCNAGTGFSRRPAVPGGDIVWSSYKTLSDARAYLNSLPYEDKAGCKTCLPGADARSGEDAAGDYRSGNKRAGQLTELKGARGGDDSLA